MASIVKNNPESDPAARAEAINKAVRDSYYGMTTADYQKQKENPDGTKIWLGHALASPGVIYGTGIGDDGSGGGGSGGGGSRGKTVSDYYSAILGQLGNSGVNPEKITYEALGYEMPTEVEIAQKISEYLRPNYDRAISSRRAQTTQNRAALDIDAASRGMGSSTWLTDAKNRQALAEAADIAGLESDYGTNLAQNVYNMYNQILP